MENRTKHYFQKLFVSKLVGKKLYSKIKFLKIYYKAKFGSDYEISPVLINILKQDEIFFDVGANLGQYIFRILNRYQNRVKIYAFEPVYNNYNILRKYISKNYNVIIENYAVSDVDGYDVLYIPLLDNIEIDTQASIDYENRKKYYDEFIKQEVKTMTIDSYVRDNNVPKIDYLKVDTEGNDEKVIKGALRSISEFKPVIFCEDMESKETLNILFNLNYRRYLLSKNYKLISFNQAKPNNVFNDLIIFIPQVRLNIFSKYITDEF